MKSVRTMGSKLTEKQQKYLKDVESFSISWREAFSTLPIPIDIADLFGPQDLPIVKNAREKFRIEAERLLRSELGKIDQLDASWQPSTSPSNRLVFPLPIALEAAELVAVSVLKPESKKILAEFEQIASDLADAAADAAARVQKMKDTKLCNVKVE